MTVRAQRGRIVIEPVKQVQYSLDELVSGINAGNLHGEADFGRPMGKEWL
ncbi:MAG: AbrB/MazE/SpoVT family DNA-binding domain-containing protein [Betaproteobacteria bacterium]